MTITAMAARIIQEKADRYGTPGSPLRVKVVDGGCSGMSYHMEFDPHAPRDGDAVVERDGATVVVDEHSAEYLRGSELDFQRTLMEQRFVWTNPNATGTCGCGESFSVLVSPPDPADPASRNDRCRSRRP
jgi:iron-sulfur cluster insertion protein